MVPTLGVSVTHAAVESLSLSGSGHPVAAVLVVVEESAGRGNTDRSQAALPVVALAGVEGENHVDRGPAGLVGVLPPASPGVVVVSVGGNTIGHHQPSLLATHCDDLLVVERGQTLVTLTLQYNDNSTLTNLNCPLSNTHNFHSTLSPPLGGGLLPPPFGGGLRPPLKN